MEVILCREKIRKFVNPNEVLSLFSNCSEHVNPKLRNFYSCHKRLLVIVYTCTHLAFYHRSSIIEIV